jgi:hypothetical protein
VLARAPDDHNRLRVCIDGATFQTLDASIQPRRGIIILARDIPAGRHTVEFVLLDDGSKPGTAEDEVRLLGLGTIGQGAADSAFRGKREM